MRSPSASLRRSPITASILGVLFCGTALAQDGTLLWEFPVALGGTMSSCPAIDENGVVYISAPDQNVRALNGETGDVLWSYPTEADASTAPVLGPDGTVYLGLADTNILALNGETGELLWEMPSGDKTWVLGLADDNTLFAHGGAGLAMALNTADGERLWEVDLGTIMPSWGMALDATGTLFLFTGGKLLSLDGGNGEVITEYVTDGQQLSSANPALGADGTAYCGSKFTGLHALDAYTGAVRWEAPLVKNAESPLILGPDGTVYVNNGALHAINAATGRELWVFAPEGAIWGSPSLAADGTLYAGADGNFHALDASNGTERWRFTRADSRFRASTIGPSGTVYVVSHDGKLYALRGSAPLANSPWPKWQQNLANTGQSHWMAGPAGVLGQSGDELAAEGSTVRLWVTAEGAPPFEYQWYRDGQPITGATDNQLVLGNAGFDDEGTYHAIVSNALGEATSEPMELTIGYSLAVDWYPILGTVTGVTEDAVLLPETEVVLEAQGTAGHEFLRWEGDIESTENPLAVQVGSNLRIRARFSAEPGTLLWTYDAGGRVEGSPAIGPNGTVYFGANRTLLAVDGDSGVVRWHAAQVWGVLTTPTPVVGDAGLIYGSDPGLVMAFDAADGQWVWQSRVTALMSFPTPVTLGRDGTVYQATDQNRLLALNGLSGDLLWEADVRNPSPAAVGAGERLYVVTDQNAALALRSIDGSVAWSTEMPSRGYHSPVVDGDGTVFVIKNTGTPCCVLALDDATGEIKWETNVGGGGAYASPSIGLNGVLYVETRGGLIALDPMTGEKLWEVIGPKTSDSSPAVAGDGTVYVGGEDGQLYAVNGQTGEVLWTFQTGDAIHTSPNIGMDGTVYVGSDDGKLYAIAGSAPLADTPWPKYQADMQNTGRVNVPPVVPVEVQLLGVGLREDGMFVFEVQGPPSAEGVLEQSENLRDWTDAGGVVLDTSGHASVEKQTGTTGAGRFYRVRLGP